MKAEEMQATSDRVTEEAPPLPLPVEEGTEAEQTNLAPLGEGGNPAATTGNPESSPADALEPPKEKPTRLASIDAFRGLTILGMLLVNNIALDEATPSHLTHAEWTGRVNFADLVFPWFLFLVGVSIPWSAASYRRKGGSFISWVGKSFLRMVGLVLVGCFIDSAIEHQPVLGLGVLQLIGLSFFVAALIALRAPGAVRLSIAGGLLLGYWAFLRFYEIPGLGPGYLSADANAVKFINETYLQALGLRGLLSVIPASALVLLGTCFGAGLRKPEWTIGRKFLGLLGGGAGLAAMGALWALEMPMNKPLWTPPYILFTAGLGAMALGAFYALIDTPVVARVRWWAFPLVVPGMNALVAYVAPILTKMFVLQSWHLPGNPAVSLQDGLQNLCYNTAGRVGGGWLYTFGYIAFWWCILLVLYRRRLFVRL